MYAIIELGPDARTASLVKDSDASTRVFDRYNEAYEYVCSERQDRTVLIAVDYYPQHFNVKTHLPVPGFWRAEVLESPEPDYGSLKPYPFADAETREEAISVVSKKVAQEYGDDVKIQILGV